MTDDHTKTLETAAAPETDDHSPVPEAPKETAAQRKKRARAEAKAAAAEIETRIGHVFKDAQLLETAFTHVSALKSQRSRSESYQRLEFLGDHVLGLVISDMLYRAFPHGDEGELSKRLADLVRKEACADVARLLGFQDGIKLGSVGAGVGQRLRKSVLGDICEAVIGAIFLDGGYPAAEAFVQRNWTERMRKPVRPLRDPKTVLQEWAQGRGLPTPAYREVDRSGPHHDPHFKVAVDVSGLESAEGEGGSKRAAEKAAATAMLEREGVKS
jgi:ribonuclease-3